MASSSTFDPTQVAPSWDEQRNALMRAYNQNLIQLNASKNNTMNQYGFLNTPDYNTAGNIGDFSNLQVNPNSQHGLYRDELTTEANMLDASQNGPSRGFTGGVANQAQRAAQQAVAGRQNTFQQNLQQTLGGFNQTAGNDLFNYQEGATGISNNARDYAGSEALWRATNNTSVSVPGASGGGSTPIQPVNVTPLSNNAIQTASSYGYQTVGKPTNLKPVTYGQGLNLGHPGAPGGQGHIT